MDQIKGQMDQNEGKMYKNEGKIHQNVDKKEFPACFRSFFPASEAATDRHQRPHFSFASGALDNLLN